MENLPYLIPRFKRRRQYAASDTRHPIVAVVRGDGKITNWSCASNVTCPFLIFATNGAATVSPDFPNYALLSDLYKEAIERPEQYVEGEALVPVNTSAKPVRVKFGLTAEEVRERAQLGAKAYNDYLFHWKYHPSGENRVSGKEFPLELLPPEVLLRRAGVSKAAAETWEPPKLETKKGA